MNCSLVLLPTSSVYPSAFSNNKLSQFWRSRRRRFREVSDIGRYDCSKSRSVYRFTKKSHVHIEEKNYDTSEKLLLHVQTLRKFPIEKLHGEIVIVRFDAALFLEIGISWLSIQRALSTIMYLYNAGAKILLVSSWGHPSESNLLSTESFADHLSFILNVKVMPVTVPNLSQFMAREFERSYIFLLDNLSTFREELANSSDFCRKISSGAYIFVNDAFSLSHKILASNVGISCCCDSSVAGFHFEEELLQLNKVREKNRKPYIAIIGGSKFLEKAPALHFLASTCDGLIFVGKLAFQVMHALGVSVPSCYIEHDAVREALKLIQLARSRRILIYYPDDFWCVQNCDRQALEIFPSTGIMADWTPADLGPVSLKEIYSLLSKCKKVLWIGPVNFGVSVQETDGEIKLTSMLEKLSNIGCEVTVVGNAACNAMTRHSNPFSPFKMFRSASVVWEFLHGRSLPGVAALDRVYPFDLHWKSIFTDPTQPLVVDIGSGNGLFLFNMSKRLKESNFLGLEINQKLVNRCLENLLDSDIKNRYFISTNATSSFRSIISSYPGDLILVAIQCPNPDFNKEEHRWRMVQRILVEAIVDLLITDGKVFLQSDVESVALRMKEQFMTYGRGNLVIDDGVNDEGWLSENPFVVRSDWEQHVIDRGSPMYRVMLRKIGSCAHS